MSATTAIVDARNICVNWVPITVRQESSRSTTTPATMLKRVNGMNWQSARIPTATGEWVSERTSHACATRCIQVPMFEITWPVKNRR